MEEVCLTDGFLFFFLPLCYVSLPEFFRGVGKNGQALALSNHCLHVGGSDRDGRAEYCPCMQSEFSTGLHEDSYRTVMEHST